MWLSVKFFLLLLVVAKSTKTRFTNVECEMLDPLYATFKECKLKILGRGIVGLNVYATLNQGPFKTAKVNVCVWRKFNGYRPFLFNTTFDFCKFMDKSKEKLSYIRLILNAISESSNLNHSCPYEHSIIVRDLVLKEEFFKLAPIPSGQYKIQIMAATNNQWKVNINIHGFVGDLKK
ncbi:GH16300 [Drosophila grimshawi]|uniref:GH16300 n=2 Tax=Drosophila grimshawi TaxID=7222 RepID=B4IY82_DROGR|nr:GH16300 [Drosophila grimshawi]